MTLASLETDLGQFLDFVKIDNGPHHEVPLAETIEKNIWNI